MTDLETHPIPLGFIPENTKTLIVGTFPTLDEYLNNPDFFFYKSSRNHFWNIIESIAPEWELKKTKYKLREISFYQNRKDKQQFCFEEGVGFIDVFTKIRRKESKSQKHDIIPIEDIIENGLLMKVITENTKIDKIACTHLLAYQTLISRLSDKLFIRKNQHTADGVENIFKLKKNRSIRILHLLPARASCYKMEVKNKQYKKLIFG